MSRPRLLLVLLAITAFAFVLRVAVAARFQGLDAPPDAESNPDQVDYELFGWRVAAGEGYTLATGEATARRPPGTAFALVAPYALFGRDRAAARIWFCLLSAATCFVTGSLAASVFGALPGATAAALLAVLPGHFYYAMHFLSEVPYGLLIALTCLLATRSLARPKESARGAGALALDLSTGLFYGLAILTRPQVAFAGPLALLAALLSRREERARRLRQVLVVGAASALVLLPWLLRNERELGKPALSTIGGVTFWGANNAVLAADPELAGRWMPVDTLVDAEHPLGGTEVENDAAAWRYGFEFLRSNPGEIPRLLLLRLVRHLSPFPATGNRAVYWSFALSWLVVVPFLAAGVVIGWRSRRAATVVLLLPIGSTLLTALCFYGLIRFRDADAALYVIPAAVALVRLLPVNSRAWTAPPATTSSSGSISR